MVTYTNPTLSPVIANNQRFFPYFQVRSRYYLFHNIISIYYLRSLMNVFFVRQGCVSTIDGMHIECVVPTEVAFVSRNRKKVYKSKCDDNCRL